MRSGGTCQILAQVHPPLFFFLTPNPPNAAVVGLLTLLLGFVFVLLFSLRFAAAGAFRVLVFVVSAASVNRPPPCVLLPVGLPSKKPWPVLLATCMAP